VDVDRSTLGVGLVAALATGAMAQGTRCAMNPQRMALTVPARGLTWLRGEDQQGPCDSVAAPWIRAAAGRSELLVAAEGPEGSGRHWTITAGVATRGGAPTRGFCLVTSTLGWRTLRYFGGGALPWTADRDRDGRPELVLWDSFPLSLEASAADYGVTAWVYEFDLGSYLALDWRLTRELAREIAAAYRVPLPEGSVALQEQRVRAADALEEFAAERCEASRRAGAYNLRPSALPASALPASAPQSLPSPPSPPSPPR
jgi:hypothetical protein